MRGTFMAVNKREKNNKQFYFLFDGYIMGKIEIKSTFFDHFIFDKTDLSMGKTNRADS